LLPQQVPFAQVPASPLPSLFLLFNSAVGTSTSILLAWGDCHSEVVDSLVRQVYFGAGPCHTPFPPIALPSTHSPARFLLTHQHVFYSLTSTSSTHSPARLLPPQLSGSTCSCSAPCQCTKGAGIPLKLYRTGTLWAPGLLAGSQKQGMAVLASPCHDMFLTGFDNQGMAGLRAC
jgi:hypothetical protein